jgi:hypothetical protein
MNLCDLYSGECDYCSLEFLLMDYALEEGDTICTGALCAREGSDCTSCSMERVFYPYCPDLSEMMYDRRDEATIEVRSSLYNGVLCRLEIVG